MIMETHWIDIILKGGYTMVALFICSTISLTIIIERIIMLRASRVIPRSLIKSLEKQINAQETLPILKSNNSVTSRLLLSCLDHTYLTKEQNKEAIERLGRQEVNNLESGLSILEIIAMISPLLGLLGTVLGLLDVFNVISIEGVSEVRIFSGGISKALITTIAGLAIAIPTLIAHGLFRRKILNFTLIMESCVMTLMSKIYQEKT